MQHTTLPMRPRKRSGSQAGNARALTLDEGHTRKAGAKMGSHLQVYFDEDQSLRR
jgi:hypothetical protein